MAIADDTTTPEGPLALPVEDPGLHTASAQTHAIRRCLLEQPGTVSVAAGPIRVREETLGVLRAMGPQPFEPRGPRPDLHVKDDEDHPTRRDSR